MKKKKLPDLNILGENEGEMFFPFRINSSNLWNKLQKAIF